MGDSTGVAPVVERKKHRSPAYPAISLQQAIKRAEEFYAQERRNPASIAAIASHWNYGQKSSGLLLTVAALKNFGLLRELASGAGGRTVQLTDLALRIILDTRPNSEERQDAIREAALSPKIHRALFRHYNGALPSDAELRHRLIFDWKFNENSVADFIKELRQTLKFARLSESEAISLGTADNSDEQYEGDEGESMGSVEEPEPEDRLQEGASPRPISGALRHAGPTARERVPNMRQDVFSLTEGEVSLQWPAALSPESFEDLRDWLEIVKRKISRSVKTESDEPNSAGEK